MDNEKHVRMIIDTHEKTLKTAEQNKSFEAVKKLLIYSYCIKFNVITNPFKIVAGDE